MNLITKQKDLERICQQIKQHKIAAIDSEFMRERTYFAILCLLQINVDGKCYAIDCLSKSLDLAPIAKIFNDKNIVKILHSSRQDLEILQQSLGAKFAPKNIFDTQIAAAFLGLGFNVSYGNLVREFSGKEIDKSCQRSNWQKRPLRVDQIKYALEDVVHLPQIYQIFVHRLNKQNKTQWVRDEIDLFVKNTLEQKSYGNLHAAGQNKKYQSNILYLGKWRDDLARKYDVPRSFIVKDVDLKNMARSKGDDQKPSRLRSRVKNFDLSAEITEIMPKMHKNSENIKIKKRDGANFRLSEKQKKLQEQGKKLLLQRAQKFKIEAQIIINQSNLQNIILGHYAVEEKLQGWRYEVLGGDIEKMLTPKN